MLNTALLSRMSQKSQHTRYEEIILGRTCCEEAPQVVPAWYILYLFVPGPDTSHTKNNLDWSDLHAKLKIAECIIPVFFPGVYDAYVGLQLF